MFTHLYQHAKRSYNSKRKHSTAATLANVPLGDVLLEDHEENNNNNSDDQNGEKPINFIDFDA